jgi:Tfp pilus assembly protein PilN
MNRFDYLHDPRPKVLNGLHSLRLAPHLYPAVTACAIVVCALAAGFGIETLRMRAAQTLERRAEARYERSQTALAALRLHVRQLDDLLARDQRLRELRLSGSVVATRMARLGNALPPRSWLTSMSAGASASYALKGYAGDLPTFAAVLSNLLDDRAIGQPQGIRMSRGDRGSAGILAFDFHSDPGP